MIIIQATTPKHNIDFLKNKAYYSVIESAHQNGFDFKKTGDFSGKNIFLLEIDCNAGKFILKLYNKYAKLADDYYTLISTHSTKTIKACVKKQKKADKMRKKIHKLIRQHITNIYFATNI